MYISIHREVSMVQKSDCIQTASVPRVYQPQPQPSIAWVNFMFLYLYILYFLSLGVVCLKFKLQLNQAHC